MLHEQTGEKERLLGLRPHPLPISNPEHSQGSRKNEALLTHPLAMAMALAPAVVRMKGAGGGQGWARLLLRSSGAMPRPLASYAAPRDRVLDQ